MSTRKEDGTCLNPRKHPLFLIPRIRISLPDHLLDIPTPLFQSQSQFKASVWALITDQEAEEEQRLAEEERKRLELSEREQEASRGGSSRGGGYAGDESF